MEERGTALPPVIFLQVLVEKSYGCNHVSGSLVQDPEHGYAMTDLTLPCHEDDLYKVPRRFLLPMWA